MGQHNRGVLTDAVQEVAKATPIFPTGIEKDQLRMLPYLQYLTINRERVNPRLINGMERHVLSEWRHRGFIFGGASEPVTMTKDFWDATSAILWEAYANPES